MNVNIYTVVSPGGAVAQLGARLDGIEEVVGSNPIGSTKITYDLIASIPPRIEFLPDFSSSGSKLDPILK